MSGALDLPDDLLAVVLAKAARAAPERSSGTKLIQGKCCAQVRDARSAQCVVSSTVSAAWLTSILGLRQRHMTQWPRGTVFFQPAAGPEAA